jgi:succinoglycan biosynthesis transport protein ExoP
MRISNNIEQRNENKAFDELALNLAGKSKTILVTSAFRNEAKDYVAYMLAKTAARRGGKVLLLEADGIFDTVRKYMPGETLKSMKGRNLYHSDLSGFDILVLRPNKQEMDPYSDWEEIPKVVKQCEELYDHIYIHYLPMEFPEFLRFFPSGVGDVLFAIQHDKTSASAVAHSVKLLQSTGSRVCGTVLTDVKARGFSVLTPS